MERLSNALQQRREVSTVVIVFYFRLQRYVILANHKTLNYEDISPQKEKGDVAKFVFAASPLGRLLSCSSLLRRQLPVVFHFLVRKFFKLSLRSSLRAVTHHAMRV